VARLAGDAISKFMASPVFQKLWVTVNRFAHSQLISVLNGSSALVASTGGQVVLNLAPLINDVLASVSRKLSATLGVSIPLPPVRSIPGCHAFASALHRGLPAGCAQIPLFSAAALAGPERLFRAINTGTFLLLIAPPLAFAAALRAAPRQRRRRILLQMTIGGTAALLAADIVMSWLLSTLTRQAAPRYQAVVSAIVHGLTNGFFTTALRVLAGGLVLTALTVLTGPYPWTTNLRTRIGRAAAPRAWMPGRSAG
jgi:hypothetical protein